MGTWGTGIFDDDLASDVGQNYRALRADGKSASQATEAILSDYEPSASDADERPVLFLALAAAQLADGVVDPRVKDAVIEIHGSGSAMTRWKDASEENRLSRENGIKQIIDALYVHAVT